ncbi:MAG: TatD family hydrolase [Gammaproteobacteria bacterium]
MLIDSHCHLDKLNLDQYNGKLELALQAALDVGVQKILCPGVDFAGLDQVLAIAHAHSDMVYAAVGSHPTEDVGLVFTVEEIIAKAKDPLVVAIGETGLDFYERGETLSDKEKDAQRQCFRSHIQAALVLQKPLVIHSRNAGLEVLQILTEEGASAVGGVLHCFADNMEIAEKAVEMGFFLGISGIVTFKNAKTLQEIVAKIPLSSLLLETDAPFLAPDPYRGKPNEPSYLPYIAEKIAKIKGISLKDVAEQTSKNFFRIFGRRD